MRNYPRWLEPLVISVAMLLIAALAIAPSWFSQGSGMRFANPWFLLGWLLLPLIILSGIRGQVRSGHLSFSMAKMLGATRGIRTWIAPVSVGLRTVVMALLVVALARPQDANERLSTQMEGIDLVLTLDMSGSMAEPDISPTRVEAAKEVLLDFISRRKNDRIGAVVFAENAYTLCPLTLDYNILAEMISELSLGVIDDKATAIGNAVGVSINRLRKSDAKSKAIILLTDGTSNAGNISPEQATEFARTLGVRIYTVLVGQNEESQSINPALLIQMAEKTGGAFFKATDRGELKSSFHSILDKLEKSLVEDQGVTWAEKAGGYMIAALVLAMLDLFLVLVVARRTP